MVDVIENYEKLSENDKAKIRKILGIPDEHTITKISVDEDQVEQNTP